MSNLRKVDTVENLEFKWGKKRGIGGKKKEVQFYESFTYDGIEYTLHDSVYLHKEGEPQPYIGKLIKIWENPDKTRKIKVLWFFRPSEILNWLEDDEETCENEIFLASGEGIGLANVNPLEAISGKCNVVCTSKDSRNPQPSVKEIQMADHIFYRTFDVGSCKISDKMDDKIAGTDVKFLFNRTKCERSSCVPKHDSDKKEENLNAVAYNDRLQFPKKNPSEEFKTAKAGGSSNFLFVKAVEDSLVKKESSAGGKPSSLAVFSSDDLATTGVERDNILDDKTKVKFMVNPYKVDVMSGKIPVSQLSLEDEFQSARDSDALDNICSEKARVDCSVKLSGDKNMDSDRKLTANLSDVKALKTVVSFSEEKTKSGPVEDSVGLHKGAKSAKDSGASEDRPSKKAKVDDVCALFDDKNRNNAKGLSAKSVGNDVVDMVVTSTASDEKAKSRLVKDSLVPDKGLPDKQKTNEKITKLSNGKLLKASTGGSTGEDSRTQGKGFEVTRKPDVDKSKWFRALPWEEQIQNAHEHGTLVLLQNLDPRFTSVEVEDIIWSGFKENCTAKILQRTAISSPHSGQALVIFKTREATERVVRNLDEGCLMLPNGRPLVGSVAPPPNLPGKQSAFFGHLSIDKIKLHMQREMAVSTSHCSQPNTIEYDMAMEWCLLQARADSWWKRLYKQQGEELRKLKANLKLK